MEMADYSLLTQAEILIYSNYIDIRPSQISKSF